MTSSAEFAHTSFADISMGLPARESQAFLPSITPVRQRRSRRPAVPVLRVAAALVAALPAVIALAAAAAAPGPNWSTLAPTASARQEVSYVQVGGKFYLAGGGTAHQQFDPQTGQWTSVAPLPANLDHIQGVAYGGKIYYIGGPPTGRRRTSARSTSTTRRRTRSARARRWARAAAGAGGVAVPRREDLLRRRPEQRERREVARRLRPRDEHWDQLPDMPTARDHFHAAVLDGKLWAIGGAQRPDRLHHDRERGVLVRFGHLVDPGSVCAPPDPARRLRGRNARATRSSSSAARTRQRRTARSRPTTSRRTSGARWRRRCRSRATASRRPSATADSTSPRAARRPGHNPSTAHHAFFPGGSARPCGGVVAFDKSTLTGETSNLPTSLQFGPDGRLYVAQQDGVDQGVHDVAQRRPTTTRSRPPRRSTSINTMPNHNDDGTLNAAVTRGRLVTGMRGRRARPPTRSSTSPRATRGSAAATGGATTSTSTRTRASLSRLTRSGSAWVEAGPRARAAALGGEPHGQRARAQRRTATRCTSRRAATRTRARRRTTSRCLPEYALSAAILSIDLARDRQHDLRPADARRPDRPGTPTTNDPFGGNDGHEPGAARARRARCRSTRRASATRTTSSSPRRAGCSRIDNGGNAGWGDVPVGRGRRRHVHERRASEPGTSDRDGLHLHHRPGLLRRPPEPDARQQGQHVRRPDAAVDGSRANPVECDYRSPGAANGRERRRRAGHVRQLDQRPRRVHRHRTSAAPMKGDLLAAGFDQHDLPDRARRSTRPRRSRRWSSDAAYGGGPLDVIAQGDDGPFPGTIWFADTTAARIFVLRAQRLRRRHRPTCDLGVPDEDGDGFYERRRDRQRHQPVLGRATRRPTSTATTSPTSPTRTTTTTRCRTRPTRSRATRATALDTHAAGRPPRGRTTARRRRPPRPRLHRPDDQRHGATTSTSSTRRR